MGKPTTAPDEKKWGGIWVRKEDAPAVWSVLDQRPPQFTPGHIVAILVDRYGKEVIAELKRATSAARRPSKAAKELPGEGPV